MDIRPLTPDYAVSPQVDPEDFVAIAAAGYTTVINNRPCEEIPPSHHADVMRDAAYAAGLNFVVLPLTHPEMNEQTATAQRDVIEESDGPVFAYCASGTRCTIIWALSQAQDVEPETLIASAAAQGYDISMMRAHLSQLYAG